MRRLVTLAVLAALAAPGSALAADSVSISGSTFSPSRALALVGDTVVWTNNDAFKEHNVTFEDGETSGNLGKGARYSRTFPSAGTFGYRCTLHQGMSGSVAVAEIHLSGPATPVLHGRRAVFSGLAPSGASVELKRGTETVATATAGTDGRFSVGVPAWVPGRYHATAAGRTSAAVALKVRPRVSLVTRRSGRTAFVTVSTTPAQVGAPVVLHRRTASGWARVGSARLGSRSRATFRLVVRGTTRVRAKLTRGVGGYSPSTSPILTLR
jgi:plastocyanin